MAEFPYFQWYPGDAEADARYRSMDDAELGFFHRCLNHAWMNGGLPADPKERAWALSRTKAYADKKWEKVGKCFFPSEENPAILVNPRQEKERAKAFSRNRRATDAANARYQAAPSSASGTAQADAKKSTQAAPYAYGSGSDSGFESETKKLPFEKQALRELQDSWFEKEFWPDFWLRKGKQPALSAFRHWATTVEKKNTIVKAMQAQRPEMLAKEPGRRKWAQGWLNDQRFDDELESDAVYRPAKSGSKSDRAVQLLMENLALEGKL